jgi:hypothetical protein
MEGASCAARANQSGHHDGGAMDIFRKATQPFPSPLLAFASRSAGHFVQGECFFGESKQRR